MEITEIRVYLRNEERLKAFATVTFDKCFVIRNMKVINGNKGSIICMPSRKMPDGTHKDIVHPITNDFRHYLEKKVLEAYNQELEKSKSAPPSGGKPAAPQSAPGGKPAAPQSAPSGKPAAPQSAPGGKPAAPQSAPGGEPPPPKPAAGNKPASNPPPSGNA